MWSLCSCMCVFMCSRRPEIIAFHWQGPSLNLSKLGWLASKPQVYFSCSTFVELSSQVQLHLAFCVCFRIWTQVFMFMWEALCGLNLFPSTSLLILSGMVFLLCVHANLEASMSYMTCLKVIHMYVCVHKCTHVFHTFMYNLLLRVPKNIAKL